MNPDTVDISDDVCVFLIHHWSAAIAYSFVLSCINYW